MVKKAKNIIRTTIRLDSETNDLLKYLKNKHEGNISKVMRHALIVYAERIVDEDKLLEIVDKGDVDRAKENILTLLESRFTGIEKLLFEAYKNSEERLKYLEQFLDAFLYAYLYHTPEVADIQKKEQSRSAKERVEKVKKLIKKDVP